LRVERQPYLEARKPIKAAYDNGQIWIPKGAGENQKVKVGMQTYRYLVGGFLVGKWTPDEEQERLNELGASGWELISTVIKLGKDGNQWCWFYLKKLQRDTDPSEPFQRMSFN